MGRNLDSRRTSPSPSIHFANRPRNCRRRREVGGRRWVGGSDRRLRPTQRTLTHRARFGRWSERRGRRVPVISRWSHFRRWCRFDGGNRAAKRAITRALSRREAPRLLGSRVAATRRTTAARRLPRPGIRGNRAADRFLVLCNGWSRRRSCRCSSGCVGLSDDRSRVGPSQRPTFGRCGRRRASGTGHGRRRWTVSSGEQDRTSALARALDLKPLTGGFSQSFRVSLLLGSLSRGERSQAKVSSELIQWRNHLNRLNLLRRQTMDDRRLLHQRPRRTHRPPFKPGNVDIMDMVMPVRIAPMVPPVVGEQRIVVTRPMHTPGLKT